VLANDIRDILEKWKIRGKVSAFVIDGGGNLSSAVDVLEREAKLIAALESATSWIEPPTVQGGPYKSACWAHLMSLSIRLVETCDSSV